jgi:hypothetical protein
VDYESFEFSIVMVWSWKIGAVPTSPTTTRLFGSDELLCIEWDHNIDNPELRIKIGTASTTDSISLSADSDSYYILGCSVRYIDSLFRCRLHLYVCDKSTSTCISHVLTDDTIGYSTLTSVWTSTGESPDVGKDYRQILALNMPNNDLKITPQSSPSAICLGMCTMYDKVIDIEDRMSKAAEDWFVLPLP